MYFILRIVSFKAPQKIIGPRTCLTKWTVRLTHKCSWHKQVIFKLEFGIADRTMCSTAQSPPKAEDMCGEGRRGRALYWSRRDRRFVAYKYTLFFIAPLGPTLTFRNCRWCRPAGAANYFYFLVYKAAVPTGPVSGIALYTVYFILRIVYFFCHSKKKGFPHMSHAVDCAAHA
jgi:hypothetical protein